MNAAAEDWLWELCRREDELDNLVQYLPDVDWSAVEARVRATQEAAWAEARARRGPQEIARLEQIDAAAKAVFTPERLSEMFRDSPLLGKLKR